MTRPLTEREWRDGERRMIAEVLGDTVLADRLEAAMQPGWDDDAPEPNEALRKLAKGGQDMDAKPLTRGELRERLGRADRWTIPSLELRIAATVKHGWNEPTPTWGDVAIWLDARNHVYWSRENRERVVPDRTSIDVQHLGTIQERLRTLGHTSYAYCGIGESQGCVMDAVTGKYVHSAVMEYPTLTRLTRALAAIAYGLKYGKDTKHLVEDA